jgi:hypothetical protein
MKVENVPRYASEQCALFASYVPNIDKAGIGVQVKYSSDRAWQSCAIFCKVTLSAGFFRRRKGEDAIFYIIKDGIFFGF